MKSVAVVILAAGEGTRMRSSMPKPLHELCGLPMVAWPVRAAREAGAERIVVVDNPKRALEAALPQGVEVAVQEEPRGTGEALQAAADAIAGAETAIVLYGDVPLVTAEAIHGVAEAHEQAGADATVVTMELADASGYGRIVRGDDGSVERIVETKRPEHATPEELAITEVNTGVYAFAVAAVTDALRDICPDNAQAEYYLPDVLPVIRAKGGKVHAHLVDDPTLTLGVNDREDLAVVRGHAQRRIHERHMQAGVTIVDPDSTQIDVDVQIGEDTVVEPYTFLRGATRAGERCRIGPVTTIVDAALGDEVTVRHAYLDSCEARSGATVGPYAYLRPGTILREGAKAGTYVEIKNSDIGPGTKVPHLSYIGDTDIGEASNIGAGTLVANYDGRTKHRTTIGSRFRGGVDTAFIAPVTVGDDAYTGAGSVITDDVPDGALAIARARQRNILDYARRVEERVREAEAATAPPAGDGGAAGDAPPATVGREAYTRHEAT